MSTGYRSSAWDVADASTSQHAKSRLQRYVEAREMYGGVHYAEPRMEREIRLTVNYCRVFVNKAASYLVGRGVAYDAQSGAGSAEELEAARVVEDYLARVGQFNELTALDLGVAITAGTLGDGAYTVRWDREARLPRITAVDPAGIECGWRQDDLRTLTWVEQRYWVTPLELTPSQRWALARAGVYVDDREPVQAREYWTADSWLLEVGDVGVDGGPNPYHEIPYVVFPNLRVPGEFWGESDLADLVELQRELNKRLSVCSWLLDVSGFPIAVVTGASGGDTATLRVGPGELWTLPEDAKADVLDLLRSGVMEAHLRYIDLLYRALHDVSEMPRTSFGDSSGQSQARSGVALEIELQPLLHKLARKEALFTSALLRRAELVLRIARLNGEELPDVKLRVVWPPALPQDREALVGQEVRLVRTGIHPRAKAIAMLGDADPDAVLGAVVSEGRRLIDAGLAGLVGAGAQGVPEGGGGAGVDIITGQEGTA